MAGGWSWWFCLGAIPKTVELVWEASLEIGGCSILLDGIPSSSSRCPQENGRCLAPQWWQKTVLHFQLKFRFSHWDWERKCLVFSQLWCCFFFSKQEHTSYLGFHTWNYSVAFSEQGWRAGLSHLEIRVFCLVFSHFQCFVEGQQKFLHIKNRKEEICIQ